MIRPAIMLAAAISAELIGNPDVPGESVLNEVEHALSRAPADTNANLCAGRDVFATNGLSASAVAVRLVSLQGGDGRWMVNGTNFTHEAVGILRAACGLGEVSR